MRAGLLIIVGLFFSGCVSGAEEPKPFLALDEPYFRCRVQPVIARDCANFACHGEPQRPLKIFARNRLRIGGDWTTRNRALAAEERAANFDAARAFVDRDFPDRSQLLTKPLDESAGGSYHRGADVFERGDVYLERSAAGFSTLRKWIEGAKEQPSCIEPGSEL